MTAITVLSRLTWDNLLEVVRKAGKGGISNAQIAAQLDANPGRTSNLTLIMFDAGVLRRLEPFQTGMSAVRYYVEE